MCNSDAGSTSKDNGWILAPLICRHAWLEVGRVPAKREDGTKRKLRRAETPSLRLQSQIFDACLRVGVTNPSSALVSVLDSRTSVFRWTEAFGADLLDERRPLEPKQVRGLVLVPARGLQGLEDQI